MTPTGSPDPLASRLLRVAAAMIALCAAILATQAEAQGRRVALVIGNGQYAHTAALRNTRNDAHDMAESLRSVGFEVIEERDLDKRGLDSALARFARALQGAEAGLFYYAGHAIQNDQKNYLVPVDAKLEDDISIGYEMTRVDDVVQTLNYSRGIKILILDACRNNPFEAKEARTRDLGRTRGLARIDQVRGMIVAYATQANDVAQDGDGRNSPFTAALVREIKEPGLEVGTLFRRVARSVHEATGGKQIPELSISLLGDFYLNRMETDLDAWAKLRSSSNTAELTGFIQRYPSSVLVDAAKARLEELERPAREKAERERLMREFAAREQALRTELDRAEAARRKAAEELATRDRQEADRAAALEVERAAIAAAKLKAEEEARQQAVKEAKAREEADKARQAAAAAALTRPPVQDPRRPDTSQQDRLARETAERERVAREAAELSRRAQEEAEQKRQAEATLLRQQEEAAQRARVERQRLAREMADQDAVLRELEKRIAAMASGDTAPQPPPASAAPSTGRIIPPSPAIGTPPRPAAPVRQDTRRNLSCRDALEKLQLGEPADIAAQACR